MEDTGQQVATATEPSLVEAQRSCTRCGGQQHLLAEVKAMGKYRCDTCQMVVGFDLRDDEPEFLIDRGLPSHYTKKVFGERVTPGERRLLPRPAGEPVDA